MPVKKLYFKKYILFTAPSKAKYSCTKRIFVLVSLFSEGLSLVYDICLSGYCPGVVHLGWLLGRWSKDTKVPTLTWHVESTGWRRKQGRRVAGLTCGLQASWDRVHQGLWYGGCQCHLESALISRRYHRQGGISSEWRLRNWCLV